MRRYRNLRLPLPLLLAIVMHSRPYTVCDIPPREGDSTQRRSSQSQVHFTTFINRKKYCIVRYRDFDTVRP